MAAPGARSARGFRRAADRHGLDLVVDRHRRRAGGGRRRDRVARACRPRRPAGASRVRVRGGPQLDREGLHDAWARAGIARPDPDRIRPSRCDPMPSQAAIAADRGAGRRPIAIVATIGTTSSTAIDPVEQIAEIAEREGLWLHVDAAYAGAVAIIPERRAAFDGWERANSIVVNPHKWLFTPLDASLLLTRRMPVLRAAFSLVPEYLRTLDRDGAGTRLQRVPAAARAPVSCAQAVDAAPLVRPGGPSPADRARTSSSRRTFAAWVDADPHWVRARAGAVLDGLLPLGPGRRRSRRGARRAQRGDHGQGQSDR